MLFFILSPPLSCINHCLPVFPDILQYYLRCSSGQVNPFQQVQDLPGSVLVVAKGPGPQARLADVSLRVVAEAVGESQGVGGDAGRRGGAPQISST